MAIVNDIPLNNKATVAALYKALGKGQELDTVSKLLASDLEWWFHGPPRRQHMMRMLTGESGQNEFKFEPRNIEVIQDRVIAEGWAGGKAYWVHVWTLKDGLITQFREYFNTWLTVQKVDGGRKPREDWRMVSDVSASRCGKVNLRTFVIGHCRGCSLLFSMRTVIG